MRRELAAIRIFIHYTIHSRQTGFDAGVGVGVGVGIDIKISFPEWKSTPVKIPLTPQPWSWEKWSHPGEPPQPKAVAYQCTMRLGCTPPTSDGHHSWRVGRSLSHPWWTTPTCPGITGALEDKGYNSESIKRVIGGHDNNCSCFRHYSRMKVTNML